MKSSLAVGADGRLLFGGRPFTGLAYPVSDAGIVGPIETVGQGAVTGTSADWIDVPAGGTRVADSFLEERSEGGPSYFGGVRFDGVGYFFEPGGECTGESEYVDGRRNELSERAWYASGRPMWVVGGGEYTGWFEAGPLQRRAVGERVLLDLITDDRGALSGIVLNDAALFDAASLSSLPRADGLMLLGAAIDASLLRVLRDRGGLDAVARLALIETKIDASCMEILISLSRLDRLELEGNGAFGLAEAREFKKQRGGCRVEADGQVV